MFDVFLKALLSIWICKQPLETNLGVGRSKFGFWGEKWFKSVKKLCSADDYTLKRAPSVQPLLASRVCTLKRTGGRLSVRAQLQHLLFCVLVVLEPIRALQNASFNLFNHCLYSQTYWNILWIGLDLIL